MRIFGLCTVRNDPDIIELSVLHHLRTGVDRVLLVDNGSTDATREIVEELGRESRVTAWRDDSEWYQGAMFTELAREAARLGADWIVPFDADEFWVARGTSLRTLLSATDAGALEGPVVNFVQRRSERAAGAEGLLSMTRRIERPIGPFERTRELVESRQIAFVEMLYPPKFVSRASRELTIEPGNHAVEGLTAPSQRTESLRCLHAPLRSLAALEAKADRGLRQDEAGWPAGLGWHARHFGLMISCGELEAEWRANTYDDAGQLDVFGTSRTTVVDESLREAVAAVLEADRDRSCPRCRRGLPIPVG
jgi:Glycosyl transferase family 2